MGETMIKKWYVERVEPVDLSRHLRAFMTELPLQQLMAKALALEPTYKKTTQGSSTQSSSYQNNQWRPQNPDRIKCNKCGRWHFKNEKCPKNQDQ